MFDTVATVGTNAVAGFVNITSTLTTTFPFDNNFTELWNSSEISFTTEAPHPCEPENTDFNCTVDEFLNYHLGAKQMPLETAIWVSSLTSTKFF